MLTEHIRGKILEHFFPGDVPNEMLAMLLVNHIDYGSQLTKLFGNASTNTIGPTSYNNYFILEHKYLILLYHQHNSSLGLNECVCQATNHSIHLIGRYWLPMLADV
jgi:hypothetical protein